MKIRLRITDGLDTVQTVILHLPAGGDPEVWDAKHGCQADSGRSVALMLPQRHCAGCEGDPSGSDLDRVQVARVQAARDRGAFQGLPKTVVDALDRILWLLSTSPRSCYRDDVTWVLEPERG